MESIDEEDEEIKQLMLRISRKEITLCETCDTFFDYTPRKRFCDECGKERERKRLSKRHRELSPEVRERRREHDRKRARLPEEKERKREYEQRPEVRERRREYNQRPEVKERKNKQKRERRQRQKKLREEE